MSDADEEPAAKPALTHMKRAVIKRGGRRRAPRKMAKMLSKEEEDARKASEMKALTEANAVRLAAMSEEDKAKQAQLEKERADRKAMLMRGPMMMGGPGGGMMAELSAGLTLRKGGMRFVRGGQKKKREDKQEAPVVDFKAGLKKAKPTPKPEQKASAGAQVDFRSNLKKTSTKPSPSTTTTATTTPTDKQRSPPVPASVVASTKTTPPLPSKLPESLQQPSARPPSSSRTSAAAPPTRGAPPKGPKPPDAAKRPPSPVSGGPRPPPRKGSNTRGAPPPRPAASSLSSKGPPPRKGSASGKMPPPLPPNRKSSITSKSPPPLPSFSGPGISEGILDLIEREAQAAQDDEEEKKKLAKMLAGPPKKLIVDFKHVFKKGWVSKQGARLTLSTRHQYDLRYCALFHHHITFFLIDDNPYKIDVSLDLIRLTTEVITKGAMTWIQLSHPDLKQPLVFFSGKTRENAKRESENRLWASCFLNRGLSYDYVKSMCDLDPRLLLYMDADPFGPHGTLNLDGVPMTDHAWNLVRTVLMNEDNPARPVATLSLAKARLTDKHLKDLTRILMEKGCQLSGLNLSYNVIQGSTVPVHLQSLLGLSNPTISLPVLKKLLAALEFCFELKELRLNGCGFGNRELFEIAPVLSRMVDNNNPLDKEGRPPCRLRRLELSQNGFADDGLKALLGHFMDLKGDVSLTAFYLNMNLLDDIAATRIANLFKDPKWRLSNLTLIGNQIQDKGAEALASLLRKAKTIMEFDVSMNLITDAGFAYFMSPEGEEDDLYIDDTEMEDRMEALMEDEMAEGPTEYAKAATLRRFKDTS